ncbi:hypothetical protein [Nocardioides sp.]|uniref:hypothetical protein n=1 Tax=Nocardioides sp. TaxID=35761 RepID=UPI002718BC97|nr:hypothetical protein [Nocardioides sp.]MDO9458271.1 hypothetical protein [Nocardioides sp.]
MSDYPPPPPPPGGYGSPPPPPPGGYGGQPGTPPYSVGNAVSYGWAKFQANAGQIIIAGLIALVAIVVFQVIAVVIRGIIVTGPECTGTGFDIECTDGSGFFVSVFASAISSFLFFVVYQIIGAGIIRGALGITEGRPFEFNELFKTDKLGPVVITSLISGAIVFVGTLLCFLPGIIASFMLSFALYFVIDKDMSPIEAITASFNLVKDNVGTALLWAIVAFAVTLVGFIACGVGAIVSIPVAFIGTAYTYKLLTGQQVAA